MNLIIAHDSGEVACRHLIGRLIANLVLDKTGEKARDEIGILTNDEDLVFAELPLEERERLSAKADQIWHDLIMALEDARKGFEYEPGDPPPAGTVEAEVYEEDIPW